MKKFLFALVVTSALVSQLHSQSPDKVRFGLRVTPQPTWFISDDKNNIPAGARFGIGFGLNMEFRISDVAAFFTGIGGDIEGGKYTFRNDPANSYTVAYWLDGNNEIVVPPGSAYDLYTFQTLKQRTIKNTYVTIPLMLKLSTKEYNGFKYFGMCGGELGIRAKTTATDTYYDVRKFNTKGDSSKVLSGETIETDINITKESCLIPLRFGINAGLGTEYRLGGSTAVFINVNFFRSLTNQMKKESKTTFYQATSGGNKYIKQNLKTAAIRISVGIMF